MRGTHLTAEQRTKIRETIISRNNAPRVDRVDFAMNVGTVVPDSVRIVEVPPTLVDIDPTWRGDEYFVVREEIVIVDQGRRIVATLPVGSESASEETGTTSTGGGTAAAMADLSSDEIREVQTVLVERGFLKGRADGMFGPETREALFAFQKHEGIETTGRIDTRTVGSLGLQDKIKAGGTRGELGTGSSSGVSQGARNSGHSEGMKDREPDATSESNRGAETSEPKQSTERRNTNPSEAAKGTRGDSAGPNPTAKNAQPGKGSMNAPSPHSGTQSEKEGTMKERDHRSER
jgi:peptidoglycan hydrolase-like protein with peptidoglycan-binding domain